MLCAFCGEGDKNNQREALTLSPDLDESLLALFSYEEEAEAFVCFLGDGEKEKGWRSEQTTAAELVSVLYEPCANIKDVVLDPLPLELSREMLPLVSMSRDLFLQYLLEERRGAFSCSYSPRIREALFPETSLPAYNVLGNPEVPRA